MNMNKFQLTGIMCVLLLAGCSDDASDNGNQAGSGGAPSEAGTDASGGTSPDAEAPDGDTTDGEAPDADASAGDPLCSQIATQRCALMARCVPLTLSLGYGDEAKCVVQVQAACEVELAAPGVTLTGQEWLACTTEINSVDTCEEYFLRAYYDDPPFTSCDLPKGTRAEGETCISYLQCASGYCDAGYASEPACGTCQPAFGDVCSNGTKCAPGEHCWKPAGSTEPPQCVMGVKVGESCENAPCADGAPCDNGVCPAPVFGTEGASCDPSAPYGLFISWGCYLNDYYCDPTTDTCQPIPTPGAAGEACASNQVFGELCEGNAPCKNGVCEPLIGWGEACDKDLCLYPASCIDGTCQVPTMDTCE